MLIEAVQKLYEATAILKRDRLLQPIVRGLERAAIAFFRQQSSQFLDALAQYEYVFPLTETLREGQWVPLWVEAVRGTSKPLGETIDQAATDALLIGADDLATEYSTSFSLQNPRAVEWLRGRGAEQVGKINETTRSRLARLITECVAQGYSYQRTSRLIRELFADFEGARALLIAVTEAGNAYEAGNYIMASDLAAGGLDMQKAWLTVGDARVEPHCRNNQAAGWIAINAYFPDGSPYPLAHPRCRCTALYRRRPE